jgi:hypothetical protein
VGWALSVSSAGCGGADERWLEGTAEEALELQKPSPDDAIIMDPSLEKKAA